MRRGVACAVVAVALVPAPPAAASPFTLELAQPSPATYGDTLTLRGRIVPALVGAEVTLLRNGSALGAARTGADGTFAFRTRAEGPGAFAAAAGDLQAAPVSLAVRPRLTARVVGSGAIGRPLAVEARVQPAAPIRVEVRRGLRLVTTRTGEGAVRVALSTRVAASYRVRIAVEAEGWLPAQRSLAARAVVQRLALGSRGESVRALEARLRELRYALPRVDGHFGLDTYQAVLAFQKLNGLPWTGRVDERVWRRLAAASVPRARHRGTHIEVSKGRQYLLVVRDGRVERVVHVSTGATGNTPIGRWQIYRKVPGWDWVLWYPMYFLRGFAIHGYPSVPAYPASHGCVRVPMWIAPTLYAEMARGRTVHVYW